MTDSAATGQTTEPTMSSDSETLETLVVVSKVKKLIREKSGFNTSQDFIDGLTQKITRECLEAIENTRKANRKTVMARDLPTN